MQQLNRNRVGLVLGSFVGFVHLIWAILVGIGWARPLLDFILWLHHIQLSYSIAAFSWGVAAGLIVVTFIVGYIFGFIFSTIWNKCAK